MEAQHQQWIGTAITIVIVGLVLALRMRRMSREQPLKIEQLWRLPAVYCAVAAYMFWILPPHALGWLWCGVAVAVGSAVGWYRGKLMRITVDPETHALSQKASPLAFLFIVVLIALRSGSRIAAMELGAGPSGLNVMTDILVAFALGFLNVQRLEMGLRARKLLQAARLARGAA